MQRIIVIAFAATMAIIPLAAQSKTCPQAHQKNGSGLDRVPDHFWMTLHRYQRRRKEGLNKIAEELKKEGLRPAVYYKGVQWTKPVVNVAFRGGNEATYKLIEATADEWTAHGVHFQLSFRDTEGAFRKWDTSDTTAALAERHEYAADIRVDFEACDGYWSLLGEMASDKEVGEKTMNLASFPDVLEPFYEGKEPIGWGKSYYHFVILHEFGHALGLAHEHFHPDCQADLKFDRDLGYVPRRNSQGEYIPDKGHRSPGALLYFSGPPNEWKKEDTLFNLKDSNYFHEILVRFNLYFHETGTWPNIGETRNIDQRSVMLYSFPDYLFKSLTQSKCTNLGDGTLGTQQHFATSLSEDDIYYFKQYYDHELNGQPPK